MGRGTTGQGCACAPWSCLCGARPPRRPDRERARDAPRTDLPLDLSADELDRLARLVGRVGCAQGQGGACAGARCAHATTACADVQEIIAAAIALGARILDLVNQQ